MHRWFALFAMSAVLVGAAACGGGDDKTVDLGNGDSVSVSEDLPDDFPDDFPIYDGADLQGAVQGEQDGIDGIVANWTTGDDIDDVKAFYDDAFEEGPWKAVNNGNAGGTTYWGVERPGDDRQVGYVTVTDGDDVAIMAIVGDDPSSGDGSSSDDATSTDGDSSSDGDSSDDSGDDSSSDSSDDDTGDSDTGGSTSDADLPEEVDLPDDFPANLVSIPDGYRIIGAQSYTSNGQTTYMVTFMTNDAASAVGDAFESDLTGNGFTQSVKSSDGTGTYAAYSENDDGTGTIIVISANEGSYEGYTDGVVQVTTGG